MSRSRRPPRGLSPDDEAIWQQVADSVHPLRQTRNRVRSAETSPDPRPDASTGASVAVSSPTPSSAQLRRTWQPLVTTPVPRPVTVAPAPAIDRKHARKIARGHVAIEGRLDLHGLREAEAHRQLRGFLHQAQQQGRRIILVITGKGREEDETLPYDWGQGPSRRGILKRNVPRWLSDPDLASIVVSFGPAHQRHGGEGALYVHIRQLR